MSVLDPRAPGTTAPDTPRGGAESGWRAALALLPSPTNGTEESDMTRIPAGQWQCRGGGRFLTGYLALRKATFKRSCWAGLSRVVKPAPEGAAAYRKSGAGDFSVPRGGLQTSLGAGSGAGPGLVVKRLVIHHGGCGARCLSLSSAGAGTGSRVLRLRSSSVVHGPYRRERLVP